MKRLTKEQAAAFISKANMLTNPVKPHEARIIQNILQGSETLHGWRFKNHLFCQGCHKELSVLDLFLSSLERHSPQYLHDYLYEGKISSGGETIYEAEGQPTIQVFKHGLTVICTGCGVANRSENALGCDYYLYSRPVRPNGVISLSEYWFEKIMAQIEQDDARRKG
ncbi:hypothetical protein [Verrucomicrobium sp. GAS474]|uniref:hypothetical protein n=1 Tax=Verrucomicrobium sp. GAS474 TaxID=1882831 RepID=UPI000B80C851|nr:hypothetical protein [Verrucomicrobium sp. GAS474]